MNRLLLLSPLLLSGCHFADLVNAIPGVGPDIAVGAGEVAASGGFSIPGWLKIIGAVAVLGAAAFGGPKAVAKVKRALGK